MRLLLRTLTMTDKEACMKVRIRSPTFLGEAAIYN